MILVKDSTPHPAVLGKTNGLAQFAMVRTHNSHLHTFYSRAHSRGYSVFRQSLCPRLRLDSVCILRQPLILAAALLVGVRHGRHRHPWHLAVEEDCGGDEACSASMRHAQRR